MSFGKYFCVILFVASHSSCGSAVRRLHPELQDDYFEGDIKLNPMQELMRRHPFMRNGLLFTNSRWPKGIVYYKISPLFDSIHRAYIRKAMDTIEAKTCIRFRLANATTTGVINIRDNGSGCNSYVGRQSNSQDINLLLAPVGYGCFKQGSILHELIHALGFFHQQSSSDRDTYVEIKMENIKNGMYRNFQKYPDGFSTNFGVPYDYHSVMHYSATAFSKNGKPTIVPKDKTVFIGQRGGMSDRDIQKIRLMYNCVGK